MAYPSIERPKPKKDFEKPIAISLDKKKNGKNSMQTLLKKFK